MTPRKAKGGGVLTCYVCGERRGGHDRGRHEARDPCPRRASQEEGT